MTSDARVERCRFSVECTQRWQDLEALVGTDLVKFCLRCHASVHLATTFEEFNALAAQGRCVAVLGTHETVARIGRPDSATYHEAFGRKPLKEKGP